MFENEFHKITESSVIEVQDTDFYACGHETNQNSGIPGTKAKTSSGVLGPKVASGAISEHQIHVGP